MTVADTVVRSPAPARRKAALVAVVLECVVGASALGGGGAMLADPEQWDNRLRDFVAQRLLACVNEQAQTPVSREEMLESMTAETLVACPQGNFAFWYGGAPIFEAVRITGTLDTGPAEAEMDE